MTRNFFIHSISADKDSFHSECLIIEVDGMDRVKILLGDITRIEVDVIVNAANNSLLGGGGVDGCVHRVAGKELLEECRTLGGCETGMAKITNAYNLPSKHVIHAVGPIYRDGKSGEPVLLYSCYRESLVLAARNGAKTIAFPCISTGIFGYPFREACVIALWAVDDFLQGNKGITKVFMVCFSEDDYSRFEAICKEYI